jgi:hypothetical protein
MRWAGMWNGWQRRGMCASFWWESQKERDHLGDQGTDGRMGSEWILRRLAGGVYSGSRWLKIVAGSCEYGDEPSSSGTTAEDDCFSSLFTWGLFLNEPEYDRMVFAPCYR